MKIGYACINTALTCRSSKTFRLKSFTPERFRTTVENNLACLEQILLFNQQHGIYFFRISSDLIPFASHPICSLNWKKEFKSQFQKIGYFIKNNNMRVSLHPGQFTILNSPTETTYQNSLLELDYHCDILDAMDLDSSHKVQIHLGGVYGDKEKSLNRFLRRYLSLSAKIKKRLVIENDERLYSLQDCLKISKKTKIPIVFDVFHHSLFNNGETLEKGLQLSSQTWTSYDGVPIVDYSNKNPDKRFGAHSESLDLEAFGKFLAKVKKHEFDLMFEVKDKEQSVLKVLESLKA